MTSDTQLNLIGTTGDDANLLRYDLVLSGGGMRAALCSLGALLFLRHSKLTVPGGVPSGRPGLEAFDRIVSASGGSVVNAGLLLQRPATEAEWDTFIGGMLARATCRRRVFAVLAVWALSAVFVVGARYWPDTPSRWLGIAALSAVTLYVVLVFWLRAHVTPPLLVLLVMGVVINLDLPDRLEWLVLLLAMFAIPVVGVGVFAWVRRRSVRKNPDPPQRRARRWYALMWPAYLLVAVGILLVAWRDPTWGWLDGVRETFWNVVFLVLVLQLVGTFLLRCHLAYLIDTPHQRRQLGGTTAHGNWGFAWAKALRRAGKPLDRPSRGPWRMSHVIAAAELREDAATYFVSGPANDALLTEAVGLRPARLADARTVEVLTALHASVAFPGVLSAAYPAGTRYLGHPSRPSDAPVPPDRLFADALSLPLLIDAGVHGTLVTAFESPRGLPPVHQAAFREYVGIEGGPRRKFVVDATACRKSLMWWPTVLIPKLSDRVVTKRIGDMVLRRIVDLERDRLLLVDPETGRTNLYAAATGAEAHHIEAQQVEADGFEQTWQQRLFELRAQADDVWMWWPGPSRAKACVSATLAACVEATRNDVTPPRPPEACIALFEFLQDRADELGLNPRPTASRSGCVRARAAAGLMVALAVVGLTCFGWAPTPLDTPTHPFFAAAPPMVLSHQGGEQRPTLQSFLEARQSGVTMMETDLRVTADGRLVAVHATFADDTCTKQLSDLTYPAPLATVDQLLTGPLADVKWLFEINLGAGSSVDPDRCDRAMTTALTTMLVQGQRDDPDFAKRVCFQFGRTVDGSERELIGALNDALDGRIPLCRCLSNGSRMLMLDGALRNLWHEIEPPDIDPGVSCVVLEALFASRLDVAQARAVAPTVLEWFSLKQRGAPGDVDEWAEHHGEHGFDGYVVDDPTGLLAYQQQSASQG